jgi:hypothetical protein
MNNDKKRRLWEPQSGVKPASETSGGEVLQDGEQGSVIPAPVPPDTGSTENGEQRTRRRNLGAASSASNTSPTSVASDTSTPSAPSTPSPTSVTLRPEIVEATLLSLPESNEPKAVEKALFELAGRLKGIDGFAAADEPMRLQVLSRWHQHAKSKGLNLDLDEAELIFDQAWADRIWPIGKHPIPMILEMVRAGAIEIPHEIASIRNRLERELATVCMELQRRQGDKEIILASGDVADALGLKWKMQGWRVLRLLQRRNLIVLVNAGEARPGGKAARCRYVGPVPRKAKGV